MFERYTEKARRVIFFARYEASQFGSPFIETEHLLLGILREDKALAIRVLRTNTAIESIRGQIESHTEKHEHISTSVDLPLSHECKRVLSYAAEESERGHRDISPAHLLLALLREEGSFSAAMLRERGLEVAGLREDLARSGSEAPSVPPRPAGSRNKPPELSKLLTALQQLKGVTVTVSATVGNSTPDVAIYEGQGVLTDGIDLEGAPTPEPVTPAQEIAWLRRKIKLLMTSMENAIANHEFAKARFYSDEERQDREKLRQLREQHNPPEPGSGSPADPRPLVCIEIIRDESFLTLQRRIDGYLAAGVAQVWMLDLAAQRAYTSTIEEGLKEVKDGILRIAHLGIELDLKKLLA